MEAEAKRSLLNLLELLREHQLAMSELFVLLRAALHAIGAYDSRLQTLFEAALEKARAQRDGENAALLQRIDELVFQLKSRG